MNRKITGYRQDAENHWIAELECGHGQHARHEPPFFPREWVTTQAGRDARLGTELNCVRCDELASQLLDECQKVLAAADEEGGMSGLCWEGRRDLMYDALKQLKKRFKT